MTSVPERLQTWLDDRVGYRRIVASLAARRVPRRSIAFYLGGITLFLAVIQVCSGILLVLYYRPDPAKAHASVEQIIGEIPYGDLIHSVHAWTSDLFVASLLAHLFAVVVRRSFRTPQELTWLSGLGALAIGMGLALTGAILPWTETGYTHARVASELAGKVPLLGASLKHFLRGGDEVTGSTLAHAYGFHIAALPACLTLAVSAHVFCLLQRPVARPDVASRETMPLYPDFIVRQAAAQTGVLVVIMTLAIFADRPLGSAAHPMQSTPFGAGPPWYFLPVHAVVRDAPTQLLGIDGAGFLVGSACVGLTLAAALPFIDRRGSKVTAWLAWLALLVLSLLAIDALQ